MPLDIPYINYIEHTIAFVPRLVATPVALRCGYTKLPLTIGMFQFRYGPPYSRSSPTSHTPRVSPLPCSVSPSILTRTPFLQKSLYYTPSTSFLIWPIHLYGITNSINSPPPRHLSSAISRYSRAHASSDAYHILLGK